MLRFQSRRLCAAAAANGFTAAACGFTVAANGSAPSSNSNMKSTMKFFFIAAPVTFAFCYVDPVGVFSTSSASFANAIDEHVQNGRVLASFEESRTAIKQFPDDIDIMWRYARSLFLMSEMQTDPETKRVFISASIKLLEKCLDRDVFHTNANLIMSAALAAENEVAGLGLAKAIANLNDVKLCLLKVVAVDPLHAPSLRALGGWCAAILQLSRIERVAFWWFSKEMPTTTFEECEKYLLRSHALDKTQIPNSLLLGDVYAWKERNDEACKWYYHAARECPVKNEEQRTKVKEAEEKLVKLKGSNWEEGYKKQ